jgi:predicted house-cleaning noncanonical NTP pyrophosphatase (MazG superfamily)
MLFLLDYTEVNMRGEFMAFEKLVRNKIPTLIRAKGEQCDVRVAKNRREALAFTLKKLDEEKAEFMTADRDHVLEECADMHEVVCALAALFGFTREELLGAAAKKRDEKGDLSGLIIMQMS